MTEVFPESALLVSILPATVMAISCARVMRSRQTFTNYSDRENDDVSIDQTESEQNYDQNTPAGFQYCSADPLSLNNPHDQLQHPEEPRIIRHLGKTGFQSSVADEMFVNSGGESA